MQRSMRLLSRFVADCGAVVTEEFIVVMPLILGAFVIVFEFGRALWAFDVMTSDVRAGVRYLARTPGTSTDITAAENLIKTGTPISGFATHAPWNWGTGPTFNVATTSTPTGFNQSMTTLTISATLPLTFPFLDYLRTWTGTTNSTQVTTAYNLRVSDQAACIGDPLGVNPCGAN